MLTLIAFEFMVLLLGGNDGDRFPVGTAVVALLTEGTDSCTFEVLVLLLTEGLNA